VPALSERWPRRRPATVEVAAPLILIVEDDPDCRAEIRVLLEEEGYAVLEAADGRTALRLARAHHPDLVIQDLLLPDSAGFELVAELRRLPGAAPVPVVALSGFPDRLDEARAAALGFTTFLRKPPAVPELCRAVRAHLESRGSRRTSIR
jgi:two-component system cell cycle response regulator DivK